MAWETKELPPDLKRKIAEFMAGLGVGIIGNFGTEGIKVSAEFIKRLLGW